MTVKIRSTLFMRLATALFAPAPFRARVARIGATRAEVGRPRLGQTGGFTPMPGHLPASSLPRPLLGEGWGDGTIRGKTTFFIDAKGTDLAIVDVDLMLL
jgi:hypothetical protein